MTLDPYRDHRDGRGRFTEGNPGRRKRSFTWLTEKEFKTKYTLLNIVSPSSCPDCGGLEHRFNASVSDKKLFYICARCNKCNQRRWYNAYRDTWGKYID